MWHEASKITSLIVQKHPHFTFNFLIFMHICKLQATSVRVSCSSEDMDNSTYDVLNLLNAMQR